MEVITQCTHRHITAAMKNKQPAPHMKMQMAIPATTTTTHWHNILFHIVSRTFTINNEICTLGRFKNLPRFVEYDKNIVAYFFSGTQCNYVIISFSKWSEQSIILVASYISCKYKTNEFVSVSHLNLLSVTHIIYWLVNNVDWFQSLSLLLPEVSTKAYNTAKHAVYNAVV